MKFFKKPLGFLSLAMTLLVFLSLITGMFYFKAAQSVYATGATATSGTARTPAAYVDEGETATGKSAGTKFACQTATAAVRCYSPQQIRNAYNIQPLLDKGITGEGRTIVIIDAFQSPTIRQDLALFDHIFGLPNPKFNIFAPDGLIPYNANNSAQNSFAGEISLDVEWAHAIAPKAAINLVLARTANNLYLENALRYAVDHNLGDVISESIQEGESCDLAYVSAEHRIFQKAAQEHITNFAASGDEGAAQFSQPKLCGGQSAYFKDVSTPASDPLVTGVGATQLDANRSTGAYIGEIALNETDISHIPYTFASGGGFSTVFHRPSYQDNVPGIGKFRGVPDVAYSGAINGGVLVVWSSYAPPPATPEVFIYGGTSVGSPQWAAITALADQLAGKRLGFLNKAIYRIAESGNYSAAFHDITFGNNTFHTTDFSVVIKGYNTREGWDPVTGWGSPIVANLVPLLIQYDNPGDGNGL